MCTFWLTKKCGKITILGTWTIGKYIIQKRKKNKEDPIQSYIILTMKTKDMIDSINWHDENIKKDVYQDHHT